MATPTFDPDKPTQVTWVIDDFGSTTPEDAARRALCIHRNPDSTATVFEVRNGDNVWTVDLAEGTTTEGPVTGPARRFTCDVSALAAATTPDVPWRG